MSTDPERWILFYFLIWDFDLGSYVQSHCSPQRVSRDLQECPVESPEDQNQPAEEVRIHSLDALFQEKEFACEAEGEACQLTHAPSPT